jgi:hypothetical protein
LRKGRTCAGECDESARYFNARCPRLRIEAPGRFDGAPGARDLIAQNRFFDQSFAKTSRVVMGMA